MRTHDVSRTRLRLAGPLLRGSSGRRGFDNTGDGLEDAPEVTTSVGRCSAEKALTGFQSKIGLFNFTFRGVLRHIRFLTDTVG
jgi:hypothetical protein